MTEIGEHGVSGASVARRANKENDRENVNAIHQLLNMEEGNAKDIQAKNKSVMKRFHAQVNENFFTLLVAINGRKAR